MNPPAKIHYERSSAPEIQAIVTTLGRSTQELVGEETSITTGDVSFEEDGTVTLSTWARQDSYRRAVKRAALRAFPIPQEIKKSPSEVKAWKFKYGWTPNQLRKSAAMTVRKETDMETAQVVLGHASKKTTEQFYAEVIDERAVEFARKFG